MQRTARIMRATRETDIQLDLNIDGTGEASIQTPVGFLTHMLESLARHGRMDLEIRAEGDTQVDDHHSVEDIGICLGQALRQAVGDLGTLSRYGHATIPMDEALAEAAIDFSGRGCLVFVGMDASGRIGDFEVELVPEFFRALCSNAGLNLHLELRRGSNRHHCVEALFKAFAHALCAALRPREGSVLSTKGVLQ